MGPKTDTTENLTAFHELLSDESVADGGPLSHPEKEIFSRYYRSLRKGPGRQRFCRHYYVEKMRPVVSLIQQHGNPVRILDAGCGLGTECLLFAALGCEVYGVDLREDRVNIALKRRKYYEDLVQRELNIQFMLENVSDILDQNRFDFIWSKDAISHIHPVEPFLTKARDALQENGKLVISDDNRLNPVVRLKYRNPSVGTMTGVQYAHEKMFSPRELTKLIVDAGLHVDGIETTGFLIPPMAASRVCFNQFVNLEIGIKRMPLLGAFGVYYTVVCGKQPTGRMMRRKA